MAVSIKVSEENYKMLCAISGKLREMLHRPVSINESITYLHKSRAISDLAGSWKMSDKEAESMSKSLKAGWKKWKPSV
jgi:hypothetical protein